MCNLIDHLTEEDEFFYQQLKAQREYEAWLMYVKEMEEEELAYDIMAKQYFKDKEEYDILNLVRTYKDISEWEIINF